MTLARMLSDLDRAVNTVWNDPQVTADSWLPRTDVAEDKDAYLLMLDVPGVDRDKLSIDFDKQVLTIRGERSRVEDDGIKWLRRERLAGNFQRSFRVHGDIDAEGITATFRNGTLTVRLPKAEKAKARQITISTK